MTDFCKVRVFGTVSRVCAQDGARRTVPYGIYTMEPLARDRYRLSGAGLPTFELDLTDVATYMGLRMNVVEGCWP